MRKRERERDPLNICPSLRGTTLMIVIGNGNRGFSAAVHGSPIWRDIVLRPRWTNKFSIFVESLNVCARARIHDSHIVRDNDQKLSCALPRNHTYTYTQIAHEVWR